VIAKLPLVLFLLLQLRKVYGDDMGGMEAREDLARMREHVVKEVYPSHLLVHV